MRANVRHFGNTFRNVYVGWVNEKLLSGPARLRSFLRVVPMRLRDDNPEVLGRDEANGFISDRITAQIPTVIGRFSSGELNSVLHHIRFSRWSIFRKMLWTILTLRIVRWDARNYSNLLTPLGYFPEINSETMRQFSAILHMASQSIDLLGSWVPGENHIMRNAKSVPVTELAFLEPFGAISPWTKALKGKRVLVVHPFRDSIEGQYLKRTLLFADPGFLPEFELDVIPPPWGALASNRSGGMGESDWFQSLELLKADVSSRDFDVAIIGAGAYGIPLAAHVKAMGNVAIVLGGSTQLLFGIRGRRWDGSGIVSPNAHWISPAKSETPAPADQTEKGAYW